MAYKAETCRWW